MGRLKAMYLAVALSAILACNFLTPADESLEEIEATIPQPTHQLTIPESVDHGNILTAEELCPEIEFNPITGQEIWQTPNFDEPLARVPFTDPIFGSCVVRVTDRAADLVQGDISEGLKNEYSRVQSFNADGRFFLIRGTEATWYVYDSATLKPLSKLPFDGAVDPRWSATVPTELYYNEETRLMQYDIQSGQRAIVHEFEQDFPDFRLVSVSSGYEGSPSMDGRFWGFMAQDEEWDTVAFLVYDQQLDQVIAIRELNDAQEVDSVTISPLANHFLAYFDYCESGLGQIDQPCGLMVYDRSLSEGHGLLRIVGHSDIVLDAGGREVLIYQDIDTDYISLLDLDDGEITPLWPIDFSHSAIGFHFSGRALNQPGWALVSTYNGSFPANATWMDDQILAIELKEDGRVLRLAHTQSLVDENQEHDYWAEPQASADHDFSRVLFTSNWGRSGTGEVETFMILLPEDWQYLQSN